MNQLNENRPQARRYLCRTHEVGTNGSVSVATATFARDVLEGRAR